MPPDNANERPNLAQSEKLAYAAAVVLVTLAYTFATGHVWEDYLITFRHSKNLIDGHGLVYNTGERVHGFTSPLGTLLPAVCYFVTGCQSHLWALAAYRFLCVGALIACLLLLQTTFLRAGASRYVRICFTLLFVTEAKTVAFSINGMECALMQMFLALAMYGIWARQTDGWRVIGIAWGGLMWTRPDGFLYIFAIAFAGLLFRSADRRRLIMMFFKSGMLCALIYLPWFGWAWWYYGSPIPQTVQAKFVMSKAMAGDKRTPLSLLGSWFDTTSYIFLPIYFPACRDGWPGYLKPLVQIFGVIAGLYWLVPLRDPIGRMASLCFALLCGYIAYNGVIAPWYLPAISVFGLFAIVRALTYRSIESTGKQSISFRPFGVALLSLFVIVQTWTLYQTSRQIKVQQAEIEDGMRTEIGLWFKDHQNTGDRIYLEPLGYIGYFSNGHMVDFPGLASPQVTAICKEGKFDMAEAALKLRPEWLVLRPLEEISFDTHPEFKSAYVLVKRFDVTMRLARYEKIPGRSYLDGDSRFTIFRRADVFPRNEIKK